MNDWLGMRAGARRLIVLAALPGVAAWLGIGVAASSQEAKVETVVTQGGPLPPPLPLFPADNWWNLDISTAPVDSNSAAFITFIGPTKSLHPDFGGEESPGSVNIYGFPYVVVDSTQPKRTVQFDYSDESDGVDHNTDTSFPFYPIPDEAITQSHWIEGGPPGNQNPGGDRHMLIVDRDNRFLYELYALHYDGSTWTAGSGAFFDMKTNNRRPETWTSADAAGLAILPGLVRRDEVFGSSEIGHAFRVTLRASNGYVYPASHAAGTNPSALPMGARLRLKAGKDISGFTAEMQRIFRTMKKHGLIVADNGSDMYISGEFNTSWDNGVLNPAFGALKASDFEVIERGYNPPAVSSLSINDVSLPEGNAGLTNATFTITLSPASAQTVMVTAQTSNITATAGSDYTATGPTVFTFTPGQTTKSFLVPVLGDTALESDETFAVTLSSPSNATISDGTGIGTIVNDELPSRTFVSASGSDAGNCSAQTTPCRNIAAALTQTAVDGEIIILTPGAYETAPLTITKGVKITSPSGTVAFVRQPITVNAAGGRVVLRGLTIKGAGTGNGVTLTAADSLSIEDCGLDRWSNGLLAEAGSGSVVSVRNSVLLANTAGVHTAAGGTNRVSIQESLFESNDTGVLLHSGQVFVRGTSFVGHSSAGVSAGPGSLDVQASEFSLNLVGAQALSGGTVRLSRSRVFGNTTGLSAAGGSTLASAGTNVIRGNGTDTTGAISATPEG